MSPFMVLPSVRRCISTTMVRPLLRMNGKGCAGSTAIGVRIGKMCVMNSFSSQLRSRRRQLARLDDVHAGRRHLAP